MRVDPATEKEVLAILEASWGAYANRDLEAFLSFYASDPDFAAFGTGADEKYVGPEQFRTGVLRDFTQAQATNIRLTWSLVSGAGEVAWVAADCEAKVFAMYREITIAGRLTAIFERRDGRWLIVHTHFSLPAGGGRQTAQSCAPYPTHW